MLGSLEIRECKFCHGEALLAKGRYKNYMFCNHCGKAYQVKQEKSIASSTIMHKSTVKSSS